MSVGRSTTVRDRHRKQIARGEPACAICLEPIDYTLPHLDPRSFVVDHVMPLRHGGLDTIENKQPAHRDCNRAKADRLAAGQRPARSFVTTRNW